MNTRGSADDAQVVAGVVAAHIMGNGIIPEQDVPIVRYKEGRVGVVVETLFGVYAITVEPFDALQARVKV